MTQRAFAANPERDVFLDLATLTSSPDSGLGNAPYDDHTVHC